VQSQQSESITALPRKASHMCMHCFRTWGGEVGLEDLISASFAFVGHYFPESVFGTSRGGGGGKQVVSLRAPGSTPGTAAQVWHKFRASLVQVCTQMWHHRCTRFRTKTRCASGPHKFGTSFGEQVTNFGKTQAREFTNTAI
jgi:hypothetical protein